MRPPIPFVPVPVRIPSYAICLCFYEPCLVLKTTSLADMYALRGSPLPPPLPCSPLSFNSALPPLLDCGEPKRGVCTVHLGSWSRGAFNGLPKTEALHLLRASRIKRGSRRWRDVLKSCTNDLQGPVSQCPIDSFPPSTLDELCRKSLQPRV